MMSTAGAAVPPAHPAAGRAACTAWRMCIDRSHGADAWRAIFRDMSRQRDTGPARQQEANRVEHGHMTAALADRAALLSAFTCVRGRVPAWRRWCARRGSRPLARRLHHEDPPERRRACRILSPLLRPGHYADCTQSEAVLERIRVPRPVRGARAPGPTGPARTGPTATREPAATCADAATSAPSPSQALSSGSAPDRPGRT